MLQLRRLRPLLRAIHGFFGPRIVLEDELPTTDRPSSHAVLDNHGRQTTLPAVLRVLSYNVKRAERWAAVAATLRGALEGHRPDVLLLQEAPLELARSASLDPVIGGRSLFFAPFHQVLRFATDYPFARYGQLVASTVRFRTAEVIELPTVNPSTLGRGHVMKRIALYVELPASGGRSVGLVNVHLEPFARRRQRGLQHEALLRAVGRLAADVTILCGDFNPTFGQRSEPGLRLLEDHGFENARADRWRVLDTCLARGHRGFRRVTSLPLRGSDHRPLLIEIAI